MKNLQELFNKCVAFEKRAGLLSDRFSDSDIRKFELERDALEKLMEIVRDKHRGWSEMPEAAKEEYEPLCVRYYRLDMIIKDYYEQMEGELLQ